ncbi:MULTISPECIES: TRAP transporter large permease [Desulfococcus]|jgi:C4-dicarboxylate transporter DctM subunit|uniref:TRAP dicarboxylate transporter, DctM subunit n=2 Tax=Desulfococcus multivorans TaxID=897 RepID=S7V5S6_DESML|nr:TRAP transporter large permease [Desulfococcus multivorans]AOY57386.1 DctM2: C4-TRAP dicarboxylate transport system permease [Desulfococcus multivorans]AQU99829.1 C4-dicarboxylate ABC transporter permease [Desulfococcus multivorans]EPR42014.1 TRAP dicarboxylate transporter, DctM subunit [Desulfococcus multivorans DSM 2059]MDX9819657.1 TRAP transporter large permease [Desulfococcus multivorans]CAJ13741.1 DctM, TRAP-type C4-dicarboxylate transport system protein [Desulfococcus multivorans]
MTAQLLILSLLFLFVINAPIAVAIGVSSIIAILVQGDVSLMMVVQRMFGGTDSFHLMAVPLFMYAGVIMEAGGISRRIIDFANALVGWLPGGLAAVAVVSAMFFAGISGSAAADAAAVGAVMIPAMKKSGYDSDFAAAVQASGGAIGVVIPPSIPMIVFGFLTGASISRLFAAGILPGVLIGVSLIVVATLISRRRGYGAVSRFSLTEVLRTFRRAFLALGTPLIILGGILFGIFTATESAAVAVVYALFVGMVVYRNIRPRDLFTLFRDGSLTASIVMFIIAAASVFSWIAAIEEVPARLSSGLLSLTDDPVLLLLLINLVLLTAGTFVETTAALILLVPMITAMLPDLGVDLVHLGAIVVTNLAIGMLTPPMGICLIVSGSISGDAITAVSRRVLPFLAILIADLMVITFFPPLTMWLSGLVTK